MRSNTFPDPRMMHAFDFLASDIVSLGEEMTTDNLREAYSKGIFPWHIDGLPLPWFCPERRAILKFDDLHIPKSLKKTQRKTALKFSINKAFSTVIENCAKSVRNFEPGTWITNDFISAYNKFHELGDANSVEAWNEKGELVGGLYGVDAGGVFCGESMFFKEPNASKLALLFLIDHLESRGARWIDIQVVTPHMEQLGATEIDRSEFLDRLRIERERGLRLFV